MGAAAELARHVLDLDHAHLVAVLLAEQGHRAHLLGLGRGSSGARAPGGVRAIHSFTRSSTALQLLGGERLPVSEVEAQLVGANGRSGLAHVRAEPLAQRRVEEMGGGVVGGRRVADAPVHDEPCALALLELALLDGDRDGLVVAEPVDVLDAPAAGLGLDRAGVGDLAATLGVEGAFGELRENDSVAASERRDARAATSVLS